jgi:uncharacterized membrane protein YkvI
MPRWIRVYLVPGAVFQSIIVGGGYGTGRELVEYFVQYGIAGAFKGLALTTVLFGAIIALTFEFARVFQAFDYRSFLRRLIGPIWPLYEINYLLSVVLVLAVVASATGEVVEDVLGLPGLFGGALMLTLIVTLNFYGRDVIKAVFSVWSVVLYVVFGVFVIALFVNHSDEISQGFANASSDGGWFRGSIAYVGYNVSAAIIALFAVRELRSRREAVGSGVAAAVIAMLPATLFTVGFAAGYPEIVEQSLPNYFMLELLGVPWITALFLIVLVGTFAETGAGLIQGVNERFDAWLVERRGTPASRRAHGLLALSAVGLSSGMATFGVITLVEKGYGLMAWGGMLFYIIPLLIVGPWRLWRNDSQETSAEGAQS